MSRFSLSQWERVRVRVLRPQRRAEAIIPGAKVLRATMITLLVYPSSR